VDIAQLAHAVEECILCRDGSDAFFLDDFGEDLLLRSDSIVAWCGFNVCINL